MTDWFLVLDAARFHVYVVARTTECAVRFDWHDNSTFTIDPYTAKRGETVIPVCHNTAPLSTKRVRVAMQLQHYDLWRFNCRTVSFLILVRVAGCDPEWLQSEMDRHDVMCGLDESRCYTVGEFRHWLNYSSSSEEDDDFERLAHRLEYDEDYG